MREHNGNTGPSVVRTNMRYVDDILDDFDRLPPWHRRIVRNCAYNIDVEGLATMPTDLLRRTLAVIQRATVIETYGADHPQA